MVFFLNSISDLSLYVSAPMPSISVKNTISDIIHGGAIALK